MSNTDLVHQLVYAVADRPSCEVLVDGVWRYGEVRMWSHGPAGWQANVKWQAVRDESYRLDTFHQRDIRPLEDISRYISPS